MSRKQLGRAAADGRMLTFSLIGGYPPITGYLVGMDDFHWFVVTIESRLVLVHKGLAACVDIHPEPTLSGSTVEDMVGTVGSEFRSYCMREFAPSRKAQD